MHAIRSRPQQGISARVGAILALAMSSYDIHHVAATSMPCVRSFVDWRKNPKSTRPKGIRFDLKAPAERGNNGNSLLLASS